MQVDLENNITRFVVQEYVNAIVNYTSQSELDFDVHKLIHTFEVADVAKKLIELANPKLPEKLQNQIMNAAILHDIGRCYEFRGGQHLKNFDHGVKGAELVREKFPDLLPETLAVEWHNKCPSENDPKAACPILDYTRDADILGNLVYEIKKMPVFIGHILKLFKETPTGLILDDEIVQAALQNRNCHRSKMKKCDFLDMLITQLGWVYILRTKAGFTLAKQENIFPEFRDIMIDQVLPLIPGTEAQRSTTANQIKTLFPDEVFLREFAKYGV